jgi:putative N6-adenine-specific DNA methylase
LIGHRHDAFVVAAPGLAELVAAEVTGLGITPREVTPSGVSVTVDDAGLFALNAQLRIASRVIVRLAEFPARDFATLEKQAARVAWARVIAAGSSVRLRVTCRKSRLYHSDAVAERVARGIMGAVADVSVTTKARPDEDDEAEDAPSQLIVVRFERDVCTISADSSGELLHRRGWRQAVAKAPLRETLAAAMLAGMGWRGDRALVDPFGGSGTIGIEAALIARCMAPGLSRAFAMEQWPGADPARFTMARAAMRAAVLPSAGVPIVVRDRDAGAVAAARANAERAGVAADVVIEQEPLSTLDLAAVAREGLLLTNPPYGLRVSDGADLRGLFARLGDVLRAGGRGWQLGLFMPADKALLGQLRVRTSSRFRSSNGGISVELLTSQ